MFITLTRMALFYFSPAAAVVELPALRASNNWLPLASQQTAAEPAAAALKAVQAPVVGASEQHNQMAKVTESPVLALSLSLSPLSSTLYLLFM